MSAIAAGAQPIWDMRLAGKKPAEIVFVTMVGQLSAGQFNVDGRSGRLETLDWRWVRDLSVCVAFNGDTDKQRMGEVCKAILRCAPNGGYTSTFNVNHGHLFLWNVAKQIGSVLTWWRGCKGLPEAGLPDMPESFDVEPMSRADRLLFTGVIA